MKFAILTTIIIQISHGQVLMSVKLLFVASFPLKVKYDIVKMLRRQTTW